MATIADQRKWRQIRISALSSVLELPASCLERLSYILLTLLHNWISLSWPEGQYCIYKKGDQCPGTLEEGFVIWDDENKDNQDDAGGVKPDGLYTEDTKVFFCCSTAGSASKPIRLPNDRPFFLFAYSSIVCQKVMLTVAAEYSAVQCSAVRCSAVRCGAVRCGAVRCGAVRCGAVQHSTVQCSTVQ